MIKKIKVKTLTEKLEETMPDVFGGLSVAEINGRKTAVSRVIAEAEEALEAAISVGKNELAAKLQDKINILQDLLDRADDPIGKDPEKGSETEPGKGPEDSSEEGTEDGTENGDSTGSKDTSSSETEDSEEGTKDGTKKSDSTGDNDKDDDGWETTEVDSSESPKTKKVDSAEKDDRIEKSGSASGTVYGSGGGGSSSGSPDKEEEEGDKGDKSDKDSKKPDDDPPVNPFKKGGGGSGSSKQPSREAILKGIKKALGELDGEANRGAKDGIRTLFDKLGYTESLNATLQEDVKKHLAQMSENELNDELASTMNLVDQILKVSYSDDLDARVTEIKRKAGSAIDRMELDREDAIHTKKTRDALRAHEKENAKYKGGPRMSGLESFKATLYLAIKNQVEETEEDEESWADLNRRYEDEPEVVKKGHHIEDVLNDEGKPSINVYFDQSGSWSDSEIEIGKSAIRVINDFHEKGEINLQLFYMSAAGVFTTASAARADGRAEGWAAALKHMQESGVKNAVILSDSDLDSYEWNNRPTGNNGLTVLDGCVWWLWKNGSYSRKALKELKGRRGNYQYSFNT